MIIFSHNQFRLKYQSIKSTLIQLVIQISAIFPHPIIILIPPPTAILSETTHKFPMSVPATQQKIQKCLHLFQSAHSGKPFRLKCSAMNCQEPGNNSRRGQQKRKKNDGNGLNGNDPAPFLYSPNTHKKITPRVDYKPY